MTAYDQIVTKIIKEQEQLMGPVAWYEAGKVMGLRLDKKNGVATILDETVSQQTIDALVNQYFSLFGRAAREVCREAVMPLIADLSETEIPSSLK